MYYNRFSDVLSRCHCVKSVQIRIFFWSVFSCIQSEYRKIRTRKKSVFLTFSAGIGMEHWLSESVFKFFSEICPQHVSEIYKTSNQNNIVNTNSSQKFFQHSVHWGINPPPLKSTTHLFFAKPPPLNLQTVQALLFRPFPPIYWFCVNTPLKIGFFSEPP